MPSDATPTADKEATPTPTPEKAAEEEKYTAKDGVANKILKELEHSHIVLTGNVGTGKTWLAQKIAKSAVSDSVEGHFYMSLWISLKQKQDIMSLLQSIARQLGVLTSADVWEDAENIEEETNIYADRNSDGKPDEEKLMKEVRKKLEKKNEDWTPEELKKHTFLLLVLDSEGDGAAGIENFLSITSEMLKWPVLQNKFKFLITTRKVEEELKQLPELESFKLFEIQPLSGGDAWDDILMHRVGTRFSNSSKFKDFSKAFKNRSQVLPAQSIMLAEAFCQTANDGDEAMERGFEAALDILEHAEKDDPIPLLHFAYEKLPDDCIMDCFWHSCNLFGKNGGVHYNELITHWMLEGHLDLTFGLKKAYDKGYDVMMKLIARGLLKMQGGNIITMEGAALKLDDPKCRGLFEKSHLGLPGLLEDENGKVFERMAPSDDGMMKTVSLYKKEESESVDKKGESESSLLIDGSRLCRELPHEFFEAKKKLKVLAIFCPRLITLPNAISEMKDLIVLVLRDCYLLESIDNINNLEKLVVLEVSGYPCLEKMDDGLFSKITNLRSLNFSGLGVTKLPSTVSNLTQLRRLVVRRCSSLESLPKLGQLKQMEVIDLSGCSSLNKIQEKSFKSFLELRFIDFSGTKIEKLPIVQTLPKLALILVKGCDRLCGMRLMKHLRSLKLLDVSGATRIKEIVFDCFDDTDNLRILDLSETEIRYLPERLSKHLSDLKLQSCSKLEKLLKTDDLGELKSLDLSNASKLEIFPEEFFKTLKSLQSLNLSNSKAKSLPSLSNLVDLRHLILKDCLFESLKDLEKLTRLVELDLSGCEKLNELPSLSEHKDLEMINLSNCKAVPTIDHNSFENMSRLRALILSETQIQHFPSLCRDSSNLRCLILNNCTKLQEECADFNNLSQLEELDLRGTSFLKVNVESLNKLPRLQILRLSKPIADKVVEGKQFPGELTVLDLSGDFECLPSLENLTKLEQLLLKGCSRLTELPSLNSSLEVLHLSETKVENLEPLRRLEHLKHLHLPHKMVEYFKKENNINFDFPPLEVNFDRCCISELSETPLFKSLKENPNLRQIVKQSNSFAYSLKAQVQGQEDDSYGDSRKLIFSDIYFKIKKLPGDETDVQCFEILETQGFDDFPAEVEHAEYITVVDSQLSQGRWSLKNIKGCWLERCTKMRSIFTHEMAENLEMLWISNLPSLESLCNEKVQSSSLSKLKSLYIDCCPTLETLFSTGQLPEKLETIQIKFCDKLKTVFGADISTNKGVETKRSSIDTGSSSIEKESIDRKAQTRPAEKEDNLDEEEHTTRPTAEEMPTRLISNLRLLHISHCPELETVFSSSELPINLKSLQIEFCDKFESLYRQNLKDSELQEWRSISRKCDAWEVPDHFKISPSTSFERNNASTGGVATETQDLNKPVGDV